MRAIKAPFLLLSISLLSSAFSQTFIPLKNGDSLIITSEYRQGGKLHLNSVELSWDDSQSVKIGFKVPKQPSSLTYKIDDSTQYVIGINGENVVTSYGKYRIKNDSTFVRIGPHTFLNSDGQISLIYNYKDGKYNGLFYRYYDNGILAEKGQFSNNEKCGVWLSYLPNGRLKSKLVFPRH